VRPEITVRSSTTRNPPASNVFRSRNSITEGINCRNIREFRYPDGMSDLKSINVRKKKINIRVEKMILNLLSRDELIKDYILILLMLSDSRFIFPRPIL
jgi:hypothetical protein